MKKIFVAALAALAFAAAASAQPRNVGGYLGVISQGVFYQHSITESQFVQVDLGTAFVALNNSVPGFRASASYNFNVLSKGDGFFNLYLGPGLGVGRDMAVLALQKKNGSDSRIEANRNTYWHAGVVTRFGVEMNFRHHMTLSIYHAPMLGVYWGSRTLSNYDLDNPGSYPGKSEGDKVMAVGAVDAFNLYQMFPTIALSYRF